jgi:hypothetical protein
MLTPKQYIIQKSNQLPLEACFINADWSQSQLASIMIYRKHTNGNFTYCSYLVDLNCLGVKDTFFRFNEQTNLDEISRYGQFQSIEYNVAHNIIYAGYEYALEFDINAHPDFEITKHFLLPDDDNVPIIDIHVGDENGNPVFMPYKNAPYLDIVKKLEKNPGKGNYTFVIKADDFMGDLDNWEIVDDEEEGEDVIVSVEQDDDEIDSANLNDEEKNALKGFKKGMIAFAKHAQENINIDMENMDSDEALRYIKYSIENFGKSNTDNGNIPKDAYAFYQKQTKYALVELFVRNYNERYINVPKIKSSDYITA